MTFTVTAAQFVAAPYNCPTNGTSNCRPAFLVFKAAAQGLDSVLNVPPGNTYNFHVSDGTAEQIFLFNGIPNLIVDAGAGATFYDNGTGHLAWGSQTSYQEAAVGLAGGVSARVQTALKGATSLTTIVAADAGIFSDRIGKSIALTAYALNPGPGGDPAHQFYEYVVPTAVNTGTGVITLAAPIVGSYSANFPNYHDGTPAPNGFDQGGPATIYKMIPEWYGTKEFRGITFNLTNPAQTYCKGQHVKFINCSVTEGNKLIPTVHETFLVRGSGSIWAGMGEIDKMIGTITIDQGANIGQAHFQDPAPVSMIVDNATVFLNGCPRNLVVRNSSHITTIAFGTAAYGGIDSVEISDSVVDVVGFTTAASNAMSSSWFDTGVFRAPKTSNVIPWASPGLKMVRGAYDSMAGFHVLDTTDDGTNTVIATDIPGATLPPWPGTPPYSYGWHPCKRVRFTNVTGCEDALNLSRPGAYDRPLYSYGFWDCPTGLTGASVQRVMFGKITSMRVNVTSAAAGTLYVLGEHDNYPMITAAGPMDNTTFQPHVDLSVGGMHVIAVPTYGWMTGPVTPWSPGTAAHFTIEIITNPGVGRTFVCTFA